jgi:hypothetical protein
MYTPYTLLRYLASLCLLLSIHPNIHAQKTFTTTGDWSNGSNWSPSGVPLPSDVVLINPGVILTIDQHATCDSLYFIAGSASSTININAGITFTVTNNVRFTDPTAASRSQTINVDAGNFVCNNITFANTSANSETNRILLSTGNVNVNGDMTMEGAAAENQIVCSGSGIFDLKGAWTGTFTYTASGSTFIYSGTSQQNIRGATYNKLILEGSNKIPNGNVTANDTLLIRSTATLTNSGAVNLILNGVYYIEGAYNEASTSGSVTLTGAVHITSTGIFQATVGEIFTIRSGIHNDGTFISGGGTYTFSVNNQSLSGTQLIAFAGAVTVTGIILTNEDSMQVAGNLTGTGTLVNEAGSYLRLNGQTNSINTLDATGAENIVIFGRSNTQTIPASTYQNLSFAGSNTKTALGDITVNDELSIASGVTFSLSTFSLMAGGGFSNNGSGTLTTASVSSTPLPAGISWAPAVLYNSASAQTIVDGTYTTLTGSGTSNGTFGNRTLSASGTIFITGTFTVGSGTYTTTNSTINFSSASSQTIPAFSYYNLVSSSGGARTLASSGTIFIAGTFTAGSSTYTVTGSTMNFNSGTDQVIPDFSYNNLSVTDGFTKSIPGNLTLPGNLVLTSGKLAIGSNTLTINGTVTSSASNCIVANGSSNLTFGGTAATTFFLDQTIDGTTNRIETFTVNRGTATVTMGGNMLVNTALVLTSGKLAPAANVLTINGSLTSTATNSISCNGSSDISVTGTGNIVLFLDQATNGTTNRIGSLTLNRAGNVLTLGNAAQVANSLTLTNGQLAIGSNTLTLNGTITSGVTNNFIANGASSITYTGSGDASLFLDQSADSTTNRLATLTINRNGNTISQTGTLRLARLILTAGKLAIGSNTLLMSNTSANLFGALMTTSNNLVCNGSSNLSITSSDNANITNGTLFFDQAIDGTSNKLASFTINLGNSSRTLTLGSNLYVQTALTLTKGDFTIGSNTLTLNGTLTSDINNLLIANGSSNLTFGNTGNVTLVLSTTTPGTTNSIGTLIFNRAGSILTLGSALHSNTALVLSNGQLMIASNILTINGTLTSSASNNFIGGSSSGIIFTGSGDASLFLDQTTDNTTNRLSSLTINRAGNVITQNNTLRTARLVLTAGQLAIGSNTLFINGTSGNIIGAVMGAGNNIRCNGSSGLVISTTDNNNITNGILYFDQTTDGTTNRLANFTIILGSTSRSITLGSNLQVNTALTLTQGDIGIGSNTLTINGTLTSTTSNNFISNGSSSIAIGGSGALGNNLFLDQSTAGTSNRLLNFSYNRTGETITLGNAMQVTGVITPTAGTLAAGSFLTLISDASGTACITAGSGSYITGNITVQRFIPAVARRFRFMSGAVNGRTLNDWKSEFYISGTGGAVNGFDATSDNGSTVYSYTESVSGISDLGWTGATNISNTIEAGRGYRVFIRGDRSNAGRLNGTETSQNAVTTDLVGPVNMNNIPIPVTYTNTGSGDNDGWNLAGNPYPCPYNWNSYYDAAANYTNIDPTIFIYDPNTNNYKSYNANANSGSLTDGIIPSGAAFFVHANAASPAITFVESHKVSTAPVALFKTGENLPAFTVRVTKDSINADEIFIKYIADATAEFDKYDISKLKGAVVNLSSVTTGGLLLTGNCKPFNGTGDTITLNLDVKTTGDYLFEFLNTQNLVENKQVTLIDEYLGTQTNLLTTNQYAFATDAQNSKTYGAGRFRIVIGELIHTYVKEAADAGHPYVLFPTLASDRITLKNEPGLFTNATLSITDVSGKTVMESMPVKITGTETQLDVSALKPGAYFLRIVPENGELQHIMRFVKQ